MRDSTSRVSHSRDSNHTGRTLLTLAQRIERTPSAEGANSDGAREEWPIRDLRQITDIGIATPA
jgi:hypothetical protein